MSLFEFDEQLKTKHNLPLCGVDEAGRGPLAGPVCCAAVILKPGAYLEGLDDSKKLSEKKREALYEPIKQASLAYEIVYIDNEGIDKLNILGATMQGMRDAVNRLAVKSKFVLIDGNRVPDGLNAAALAVVKGDGQSACIAAASVLAKVARDRLMRRYHEQYPQYAFDQHKGYPTKLHYERIEQFGICPIHRKSFLKGRV